MASISLIEYLLPEQDLQYAKFTAKLIPTQKPESIIGVRMPKLRALARQLQGEQPQLAAKFLHSLPHQYHEENLLHAILIANQKDSKLALAQIQKFLPHVNNWAVCDALTPKSLHEIPQQLYSAILSWADSPEEYTQRYAFVALMQNFLGEHFEPQQLTLALRVDLEQYYVLMAAAWYLATAADKQANTVFPVLLSGKILGQAMPPILWRKAIQKTLESNRIPPDFKTQLKQVRATITRN